MPVAPKGFNDIMPGAEPAFLDARLWQRLLDGLHTVMQSHGYQQVLLPMAESTELFARGLGAASDIVSKEMYSFTDRGGRGLTLRPEGTAGICRAFVEHHVGRVPGSHRWYYVGPMFRAERPQKGRYRQFYQLGAECLGVASVAADVELLLLGRDLCQALALPPIDIQYNSLGDAASRQAYRAVLLAYLTAQRGALCASCNERLQHNVLRVLDCKRPDCQAVVAAAPDIRLSLSAAAAAQLDAAEALMAQLGLQAQRVPRLVRGLDYYTGLIFEFVEAQSGAAAGLGAQSTVLGGGRYDDLIAELGGPPTPALGFAAGLERLALLLAQQSQAAALPGLDLLLLPLDPDSLVVALRLAAAVRQLRRLRVEVDVQAEPGRLKQQLRRADRLAARHVLVLGETERRAGRANLKDLQQRREQAVALDAAALVVALGAAA